MHTSRIVASALSTALAAFLARSLSAQSGVPSGTGGPVWQTLMQKPLPEDAEPKLSVVSIPVPPAPPEARPTGAGHTHAGPVFAYILQGEIENQAEPDPPEIYKPGDFFYEAPGHVHRFLRNLSTAEPAKLIIFQSGATGTPALAIKMLLQEPLLTTKNQEVSLLRLTLAPLSLSETPAHSNPDVIYVLEGKIETTSTPNQTRTYNPGDLFLDPANRAGLSLKNPSGSEPAKLLLYHVSEKREQRE
jgi:quercetin dioxygenase-like cupin family protein